MSTMHHGTQPKIRAIYVYGDGAMWKLNRAALQAVVDGADFTDGQRLAASRNYRTGRWSRLPAAVVQSAPYAKRPDGTIANDERNLYSWKNGYDVVHYDSFDADLAAYYLEL